MNPPPQPAVCPTCGNQSDKSTGLCLACLMLCATTDGAADSIESLLDASELPRIGNYEVLGEIGRGGMGVIYRARQTHTGRIVAVKILQSHTIHKPEMLARFRREAQAATSLDHPHVLPIYEVNEEADGIPFFSMKLAAGGSLIDRRDSLKGRTREIVTLIAKVARATQHAHERGVLHRDLKPGNILFDAQGEPMVSDFGLAAWLHQDSDLTRTIMVCGTPGYLPPEYLDGRPDVLLPASDVYSLGVILFELLAGQLPYAAGASLSAIRQATEKPAPLLRTLVPNADRDLEVICARCIEAEPGMRYLSAGALADDLQNWLEGRPIVARPTPRIVRVWKWVRRYPAISLAGALCLLLAATGLILNGMLTRATAYDRAVAILPVEDLDAMSHESPLSREATQVCLDSMKKVRGLTAVATTAAPDPFPHDADLVRLSRALGARYLVSATIRRKDDVNRLVIRLADATGDTSVRTELIECSTLGDRQTAQAIAATIQRAQSGVGKPAKANGDGTSPDTPIDPSRRLAESYIQAGDQHFDRRAPSDIDHAIDAYQKAANEQPGNALAKARLATAMAARGFLGNKEEWLAKALPIARQAVAIDPLLAEAHRTLSNISYFRGELLAAREQAIQAFELLPDDPKVASAVAEAMRALGAMDEALVWNRKATLRQHTPGEYAIVRGDCLAALGEFAGAAIAYREFTEYRPDLADGPAGSANLHLLSGNAPKALEEIRALHARFPTHPIVLQTRASMEFHVGDPNMAAKMYGELAADADAGLTAYMGVRACSALGFLALRRGDADGRALIERALALDEEALSGDRKEAAMLFERAANLAMLGRTEDALKSLRQAIECADWTYFQMKLDPRVQTLREMPAFAEMEQMLAKRLSDMRGRISLTHEPKPQ